ncbi:MAG TPA: biopolymer transporter ExbD [bacterium]|nr:biopolymer transporter ExbD [bacterium]
MQFREKKKKRVIINITSLVDVLFLLLIFFIVSSTFIEQPGMKLDLPETSGQPPVRVEGVVLSITADGAMYLNDDPVTLENLKDRLKPLIKNLGEEGLMLKADEAVRYGLVVEAMDTARLAGVQKLVVVTRPREER